MIYETKDIIDLKGIGAKKKTLFNKIGIFNTDDMISYFPKKYKDMRKSIPIEDIKEEGEYLIRGRIVKTNSNPFSNTKNAFFTIQDDTGKLDAIAFNQKKYFAFVYKSGYYYFYGKVIKKSSKLLMVHPDITKEEDFHFEIRPVYNLTKGISQREFRNHIKNLLNCEVQDNFPKKILDENNLVSKYEMIKHFHFPQDKESFKRAKFRKVYEELFNLILAVEELNNSDNDGLVISKEIDEFVSSLNFELTKDQDSAITDILKDLSKGKQMTRLLQGDVGSGKTIVAFSALFATAKSNFQGAMLVPTEILAKQHYEKMVSVFSEFNIKVCLLTSSTSKVERKSILIGLENGEIQIVVGTHALLYDSVKFKNLAMVVTDEQHRFGVNQRIKIGNKGIKPHILVMTATPIPRSLAIVLYGNVSISTIKTMPKGRKPIKTYHLTTKDRNGLYEKIKECINKGEQGYVVTPLIAESQELDDVISVDEAYIKIKKFFKDTVVIETIHGQKTTEEKNNIMEKFYNGDIDILVSTVVIEVGIDVPNATFMVIENAERFGLAQLHQLRGRIGRGIKDSNCYLISDTQGEIGKKRIEIMVNSNDGFELSEKDLTLRGPGEIFGTSQHGASDEVLQMALKYDKLFEKIKKDIKLLSKKEASDFEFNRKEYSNMIENIGI